MNLVDTITCNLAKVGGVRLEVRARPSNGTAMEETLRDSADMLEELCHYISHPESPLVLKQTPSEISSEKSSKGLWKEQLSLACGIQGQPQSSFLFLLLRSNNGPGS